jgi:hypothetical protein
MSNTRNLPDWINGFMDLSNNSEPPKLFRKWTAISTIAAALQRKVRLEFGMSMTFYPNLYIVLVGNSSTGKGTAMGYSKDIIENIPTIKLSAQATSLQALIKKMHETNLTDIDMVTGQQHFHSSLTIFSNEFTVFLGYSNRELITALCDWYDCSPRWSYETIARKKEEIIGVWTNLIAGTTPEAIQTSFPLEAIGLGLASRIIFVWGEKREKLVIWGSKTPYEIELQQKLIRDLEGISMMSGEFNITEGFKKRYEEWCIEAAENKPFFDKKFDGYCGRRRKHLLTLTMICSASESDNLILTSDHLNRAIDLLAEVEVNMPKVFRGIGRSDISSLVQDTIVFLTNSFTKDVPIRDIARHFESDMDKLTLDRVLLTLETIGYVTVVRQPGMGSVVHVHDKMK